MCLSAMFIDSQSIKAITYNDDYDFTTLYLVFRVGIMYIAASISDILQSRIFARHKLYISKYKIEFNKTTAILCVLLTLCTTIIIFTGIRWNEEVMIK